VIDVQLAAFKAVSESKTMKDFLAEDDWSDYFVALAVQMAERERF
jgi:hypothetical protein